MKLSSISVLALSAVAAAQPRNRQHPHPAKRQNPAVDVITDVVTTTQAAAVVFVDQNGNVLSTSTAAGQPAPTVAPEAFNGPPPPAAPPSPPPQKSRGPHSPHPHSRPPTPSSPPMNSGPGNSASPQPPASSGPASGGSGGSSGSLGYGISYSPYNNDGSCKSQDQVNGDFAAFDQGYGFVRSYGVDCNQASTMLSAATGKGMKMIAGIYDISQVQSETQTLIDAAKNNWDAIDTVIVGNEAVTNSMASVDQVVSAVNQARSMLKAAGYNGNVVTVDTFAQILDNPQLCQASDFPAANCHAFFNAEMTPDQAGPWVKQQADKVSAACGGKQAMITESGWPSQGQTNGNAVPSLENQKTAIGSLRGSFSNNIVLFSAFNDYWKQNNPSTFGAEQFWGIYGNAPS